MQTQIKQQIIQIIKNIFWIEINEIKLDIPPKKELWDFAFGCFLLAKDLKKSPAEIGNILLWEIKKIDIVENVELAWPYLNIKLKKDNYTNIFNEIYSNKEQFLKWDNNFSWNIVIDYIWANVWKPLHIGHMCTPNQWQVLINLYKKLGYNVISDSHIWDWWIIFWKLIYSYKNFWWNEEKLKQNAVDYLLELYIKITNEVEKDKYLVQDIWNNYLKILLKDERDELIKIIKKSYPDYFNNKIKCISHPNLDLETFALHNYSGAFNILKTYILSDKCNTNFKNFYSIFSDFDLEQKIRDEFKLLSEENKESIELWEKFTKYSIDAMNKELARLNIKPDFDIWESFYEGLELPKIQDYPDLIWNMKDIVKELIEKKIATKNEDGSVWVEFKDEDNIPSCILQKRDWTHWYLASDLAAIKYRMHNWKPEKIVYFVDIRQSLHLKQAFTIAKKAWWLWNCELFHAANWFIALKDWAMSTRTWRIIKLDKLLDEAEERAKKIILEKRDDISGEELKKLSRIIWIWAIKYWYLKKSRETDVIFDWDEFMTFEWNSWPYIQYAYVRAIRILENYWKQIPLNEVWTFENDEEIDLLKTIQNYNEAKLITAKNNTPHILCKFAYELTKSFNTFYNNVHILNEKDENKKIIRLKLLDLFITVLKDCFEILWIEMPNKM